MSDTVEGGPLPDLTIECPECGNPEFTVVEFARVGISDDFGILCAECDARVLDVSANDVSAGLVEQLNGGDHD